MSKKILLIGNTRAASVKRLVEEADLKSVVFDVVPVSAILFDGESIEINSQQLRAQPLGYDVYFFRGLGSLAASLQTIAAYLVKQGKRVVEARFPTAGFPEDKIVSASQHSLYKVPESMVLESQNAPMPVVSYPIVGKKLATSMGRGVQLLRTAEDLNTFLQDYQGAFMLQQYFNIDYDTRVFVVGGKVLGAFNRFRKNNHDFLTVAKGNRREPAILTPSQEKAAIEATVLQGLEIAGVDMFTVHGEVYIIEVNASPQFRVFEKQTGINASIAVLEHLLA